MRPSKRGNFRSSLHETENVVDEEQYVEMFLIAEIFRNGQTSQTDAQTRSGRFGHLSVNQRARDFSELPGTMTPPSDISSQRSLPSRVRSPTPANTETPPCFMATL